MFPFREMRPGSGIGMVVTGTQEGLLTMASRPKRSSSWKMLVPK